jgi:hypothetical protein
MFYKFQCATKDCVYNITPCFVIDATKEVLCGGCQNKGTATAITNDQAIALGLITESVPE